MPFITEISSVLIDGLHDHMSDLSRAFRDKNIDDYSALGFSPAKDGHDDRNTKEYIQALMASGLEVSDWKARSFKQPNWSIFKDYRLAPEPRIWVDVYLKSADEGKRSVEIYLALAVDENGKLKRCHYVKK